MSPALPVVLLTAFEPFDGSAENASLAALDALKAGADWPTPIDLRTGVLPVETDRVASALDALLASHRPAVVVLLGESARAECVTLERLAVNLRDFRVPDNAGAQPVDEPVEAGGPDALWSTLPVRACVQRVVASGGEAALSLSAGAYLCNQALYIALRWAQACPAPGSDRPSVGFVHLPSLPSQVARGERGGSSQSAERSAAGVVEVVAAAVASRQGVGHGH